MSSTIRRRQVKRGKAEVRHRKPGEVRTAWTVAIVIVASTVFAIWFLRHGGLAQRQPKATALVAILMFTIPVIVGLAIRPTNARMARRRRTWVPASLAVVMVGLLVMWLFAWDREVIRRSPTPVTFPPPQESPTTAPTTTAPTTTAAVTTATPTTAASTTTAAGG